MTKLLKITLLILVIIAIAGTLIYLFIFSPLLANNKGIISVRNFYVRITNNAAKSLGLEEKVDTTLYDTNPIQVLYTEGSEFNLTGRYRYGFKGKINNLNAENRIISFLARDNKTYAFKFIMQPFSPSEAASINWVRIAGNYNPGDGTIPVWYLFNTVDYKKSGELDKWYKDDLEYYVVWDDSRKLSEITDQHKLSPDKSLNDDFNQIIYIRRYEKI